MKKKIKKKERKKTEQHVAFISSLQNSVTQHAQQAVISHASSVHLETLVFPSRDSEPLVLEPFRYLHARQPGNVNNRWVRVER